MPNLMGGLGEGAGATNETHRRIADIELLRAFAILFTLLQHVQYNLITWPNDLLSGTLSYFHFASGVDLFLVVSGFVIARSLVPTLGQCRSNVEFARVTLAFWVRRAWRLVPSAWFWLALILVASIGFNRSGAFGTFRENFEATVAAVLNVVNLRDMVLFGRSPLGASSPYWSLSLEEQFYLLLPVLVFVSRRWLPLVLGVLVLLQLGTIPSLGDLFIKPDGLMLGVLIALWSRTDTYPLFEPRFLRHGRLVRGTTLVLLLMLLSALDVPRDTITAFNYSLVSLVSAALVLIASYDRDYLMRDGVVKRLLLWVGSRSYALYLVHMPMMFAARELWLRLEVPVTHGNGRWLVVSAFALTGVVAELNFRLIETPLRRKGARIADAILTGRPPAAVSPDLAAGDAVPDALEIVV